MQKSDNRQRVSRYFTEISPFQLIFTDLWFLKNINTGKTSSHVVKNTLSRHYKALQFAYFDISKFFKWKARLRQRPDRQQQQPINAEVNIYLNSWTKFPPINYQPATVKSSKI